MSFIDEYLDKARPENLANVVRSQAVSARELARRTLNVTTLDQITPRVGTRIDTIGNVGLTRLNRLLLFTVNATPPIVLPSDALTGSNILEVILTGQFFQNTGSNQTITPRFYIGKTGSETLVSSDTPLTVASGAVRKTFFYTLRVSAAPSGGTKVQVDEKFDLEHATAGTINTIMRTTRTTVIDITELSEVDSCFIRIANGATPTMFRIYTNTVSVQVLNAVQAEEIHWFSQPIGTAGDDTYLSSGFPTTNYSANAWLTIGEANTAVEAFRSLIKFSELDNFLTDPDLIGFQISEAYLYLTISGDFSSNARTYDLYRLLVDFVEAQATWNVRKTATNWGTAGGQSGVDYDATAVASCSFGASDAVGIVKSFGFSASGIAELQKIIDGTYPNYGFIAIAQTESNDAYIFDSAETATPDLSPMLYLVGTKPN